MLAAGKRPKGEIMEVISIRFTNADHTRGEIVLANGAGFIGPLPPLDGEALEAYQAFIDAGGAVADFDPSARVHP